MLQMRFLISLPKLRYKYCSSSVIYLKKLRNNEFKNVEEWSKEFFDGSIPLDDLKIKEN
jgi:hypothetical protein